MIIQIGKIKINTKRLDVKMAKVGGLYFTLSMFIGMLILLLYGTFTEKFFKSIIVYMFIYDLLLINYIFINEKKGSSILFRKTRFIVSYTLISIFIATSVFRLEDQFNNLFLIIPGLFTLYICILNFIKVGKNLDKENQRKGGIQPTGWIPLNLFIL